MSAPDNTPLTQVEPAAKAVEAELQHPTVPGAIAAGEALTPIYQEFHAEGPAIVTETRRGWKTTEFWGVIVAAFYSVGPLDVSSKHAIIVSGLAVIYAVARGIAKAGSANVTPAPQEVTPTDGP